MIVTLAENIFYQGDINEDGILNTRDLGIVGSNYKKPNIDSRADINGDGVVDISDLLILGNNYGKNRCQWAYKRVHLKCALFNVNKTKHTYSGTYN